MVPSERKGQPVCHAPPHQGHPVGKPDACRSPFVGPRARGEIYRHQEEDTEGQGESKEDGEDDVCGRHSQWQEVAEKEEDEDGDDGEGQQSKGVRPD